VLVVDDSATARRSITRALAGLNAHVATAGTAQEALNLLCIFPTPVYDVVTCDLNLPGMNGLELIAEIQRRFKSRAPRVVVISDYTDDRATARELRAAGITWLLPKPSFRADVREAVGTAPRLAVYFAN
jgi:CheY-like chemotaxis protein